MINGENIWEVLAMVQHLELPIDVRRECNMTFVKCTADVKGGQSEAFNHLDEAKRWAGDLQASS